MKDIEDNSDLRWNWLGVSWNPNLTMEFVKDNPDKGWDWLGVSWNPKLTMEFVKANPDLRWDWYGVSWNPNLTMEFIEAHPDLRWDWSGVSCNTFKGEKQVFMEKKAREYMASYKIKSAWTEVYLSPYTEVGKRRLLKEYHELFG